MPNVAPQAPESDPRRDPAAEGDRPALSVVIPAYNESRRIPRAITAIRDYARSTGAAVELIVVDDGSADGTADLVRSMPTRPLRLRVLVNPSNRGKGYSVRRGMLEASGELLLMCDADLSTPIEEFDRLRTAMDEPSPAGSPYAVAVASRDRPDSVLSPPQPWYRRRLAGSLRAVRRLFLLRRLRDTQCGFKLFRRSAARRLFALQTVEGFAFDIEILALAERLGYGVREVGVRWQNDPDTRVRLIRDGVALLAALPRIWWRVRRVDLARWSDSGPA